jgi:hypothetical protein
VNDKDGTPTFTIDLPECEIADRKTIPGLYNWFARIDTEWR